MLRLGVLLVFVVAPPLAYADSDRTPESGSLAGFSVYAWTGPYTTVQGVDASVDTDYGPNDRAANTLTNLGWLFQLGVQSPPLERVPGRPRVDVSGGVLIPTNQSSTIGTRLDLSTGVNNDVTREESKLQLDYSNSYRGALALDFPVRGVLPIDLFAAPGIQYLYLDSRWVGAVESERTFPGGMPDAIVRGGRSKVNFTQHLFGPSLRISTESVRIFGLQVDVYAEGAFLFDMQGTRRTRTVRDANNRRSTFNWEADATAGSVSLGLRIRAD